MKLWASTGQTESGDDIPVLVWDKKPTKEQVDAAYKKLCPIEYRVVGFVNHRTDEAKVMFSMNPRARRAIDALREPDASLSRVPNTVRQSIAEVIEDQATALERAYGILWRMPDAATGHARKLLLEAISPEGQKRGIAYALELFGQATEAEFLK